MATTRRLRGRFGPAQCEIHVCAEQATPYVVDNARNALTWFPDSDGQQVTFKGESALDDAVAFLEKHIGQQAAQLEEIERELPIKKPKIPPPTLR